MMNCPYFGNCKKYQNNTCDLDLGNFCQKKFRLDKLFDEALVSEKQRIPISLIYDENIDGPAYSQLKAVFPNISSFINGGYNLYIYSEYTGNGKTTWALSILSCYLQSIWYKSDISCRALFISVPKFLLALKDNITKKSEYIEHIKENVLKADLVIWDDIGSKCGTEFEIENMLSIINSRIDEGKSNIYTSNLDPDSLSAALGSRLASRVVGMSELIHFREADKRGIKV